MVMGYSEDRELNDPLTNIKRNADLKFMLYDELQSNYLTVDRAVVAVMERDMDELFDNRYLRGRRPKKLESLEAHFDYQTMNLMDVKCTAFTEYEEPTTDKCNEIIDDAIFNSELQPNEGNELLQDIGQVLRCSHGAYTSGDSAKCERYDKGNGPHVFSTYEDAARFVTLNSRSRRRSRV